MRQLCVKKCFNEIWDATRTEPENHTLSKNQLRDKERLVQFMREPRLTTMVDLLILETLYGAVEKGRLRPRDEPLSNDGDEGPPLTTNNNAPKKPFAKPLREQKEKPRYVST